MSPRYILLGIVSDSPSERTAIIEWGKYSFALRYLTGVEGDEFGVYRVHFIGGAIDVVDERRR